MSPLKKIFFLIVSFFSLSLIFIIFCTAFFVNNFERISFYEYDILLKQRMNIKDQNNDIIIIGDSAGLNGLIANNIQNDTGKSIVNLSLYANNGIKSYEILLKNYLENNKTPDTVVLYFSVIAPINWKLITYEKAILIFRYSKLRDKITFIFKNPYSIILISNRSVRALIRYAIFGKEQGKFANKILDELNKTKGFIVSKSAKKENICEAINPDFSTEQARAEIKNIKSIFSTLNIKVYMAPIIKCIYQQNIYTGLYDGMVDNDLYFLEEKYFNDFSHLNLNGAIRNSSIFSDWILKQ